MKPSTRFGICVVGSILSLYALSVMALRGDLFTSVMWAALMVLFAFEAIDLWKYDDL